MRKVVQNCVAALFVALCILGNSIVMAHSGPHQDGWVDVGGNVYFGETPVCALVLVNGQSQFSCDGAGRYDMTVPVDDNGMITVMVFVDGFAPFSQIVTPEQAAEFPINILLDQNSPSMQVRVSDVPSATAGRQVIGGTINVGSSPVCTLVLANGQSMFSCNENLGKFYLDVPLDQDGNITLMVFADGFKPFKHVISPVSPSRSNIAEGLWIGSTSNNRAATGLVLDDGTYYFLYSAPNNPSLIAGIVQGNSSMNGNEVISPNARDFNLEGLGILPATVSATVSANQSFNGTINYLDGSITSFSTTYSSDYDLAPSLLDLAGNFSGAVVLSLGQETANISIAQNGAFSGTGASGCTVGGIIYPRTSGNVFNLSIQFGGSPCFFAYQSFSGIVYFDSANQRIYAAAPNANRTDGLMFVGDKR
jgi:hypothetical protein